MTVKLVLVVGGPTLAGVLLVVIFFLVTLVLVRRKDLYSKEHSGLLQLPPNSPLDSECSTPTNIYSNCTLSNGFEFPKPAAKPGVQWELNKILQSPLSTTDENQVNGQPHALNRDEQDVAKPVQSLLQ